MTFRAGVPIEVDGIRIDYLSPNALGEHLAMAFEQPREPFPVVPLAPLIFMKLQAGEKLSYTSWN